MRTKILEIFAQATVPEYFLSGAAKRLKFALKQKGANAIVSPSSVQKHLDMVVLLDHPQLLFVLRKTGLERHFKQQRKYPARRAELSP